MPHIDVHLHLGKWNFPEAVVSPTEMVATLSRWDIQQGIVSSSQAIVYNFLEGNAWLAGAIAPHPELFGYVVLNLNYPDESEAEMARYLPDPKFVGAKIHPMYCRQKMDSPNAARLLRKLAEYGKPLLLHTYSSPLETPWNVVPLAKTLPQLPIILGHMGGDRWDLGLEAASQSPNLFVEPCCSWADPGKVVAAVRKLGAERVLFGSDYTLFDPGYALGMVTGAALAAEQKEMILGENARRLFGLP